MLIVLPLLCFLALFFHLNGVWVNNRSSAGEDWRGAFLRAVVIQGILLVLVMEGLTLFSAINQIGLAIYWLIVFSVIIGIGLKKNTFEVGIRDLLEGVREFSRIEVFLILAIVAIASILFTIAIIAPPNNVDSLLYHMPRVVHWAQNESLRHYPTARLTQVIRPNLAELSILNLRVLLGSDRPANLLQWFSMVGSVIVASGIAKLFGVNKLGQILAAAFAISLPMVILQSTSTQNDLVAALWVVVLTYFIVRGKRISINPELVAFTGATLGLGILTKGTFFAYAIPLMIWYFIPRIFRVNILRTLSEIAIIAIAVVLLNAGFWARNVSMFGDLYGSPGSAFGNLTIYPIITSIVGSLDEATAAEVQEGPGEQTATPVPQNDPETTQPPSAESPSQISFLTNFFGRLGVQAGRTAQLLAMNAVSPGVGKYLYPLLARSPQVFPPDFIDQLENGMWNHEDTGGSIFHLGLILLSIPSLFLLPTKFNRTLLISYALATFASLVMLTLISYSVLLYSIRYQLGFFLLWAPLVGVTFSAWKPTWIPAVISFILILFSLPYVFLNNTRPVLGMAPERTRVGSIFTEPMPNLMFANVKHLQDDYYAIRDDIEARACKDVGLQISGGDAEYLFWWIFRAPQSGTRFEVLNGLPELSGTMDPEFQPCAIICSNCSGIDEIDGFSKSMNYGRVQLFLSEGNP